MEASTDTFEFVVKLVEIVLIPILWKIYSMLSLLSDRVNELRTILIGVDGKNGIRSRVRRLENKFERLALIQAAGGKETAAHHDSEDEED